MLTSDDMTLRRPIIICVALFTVLLALWHFHEDSSAPFVPLSGNSTISCKPSTLDHIFELVGHGTGDVHESEYSLPGDAMQYVRIDLTKKPTLLWLMITYDSESFGTHNFHQRTIKDFINVVTKQVPPQEVSLGLLTSSTREYNAYIEATRSLNFARVMIILHPGFHKGAVIDRIHRQDRDIQTARRSELAKLRNFLMLRALRDEQHILWLDADVHKLDNNIVRRMLQAGEEHGDIGIITARCSQGGNDNYDHNAWRGTRQGPRGWDLDAAEVKAGELSKQGQYHVPAVIKDSKDNELLYLDTVGATILYMKSTLVLQGLTFPSQYVVGTRWGKDGWDGIESEGLCYNARGMTDSKCAVLGGSWHVEHTKK